MSKSQQDACPRFTTPLPAPGQVAGGSRATVNYPHDLEHPVPVARTMKASLITHEEVNSLDSQESARQAMASCVKGRGRTGYCCT